MLALAGDFRTGTLTALRELALLWLAERVDAGLSDYRTLNNTRDSWQTRERIVVGLSGQARRPGPDPPRGKDAGQRRGRGAPRGPRPHRHRRRRAVRRQGTGAPAQARSGRRRRLPRGRRRGRRGDSAGVCAQHQRQPDHPGSVAAARLAQFRTRHCCEGPADARAASTFISSPRSAAEDRKPAGAPRRWAAGRELPAFALAAGLPPLLQLGPGPAPAPATLHGHAGPTDRHRRGRPGGGLWPAVVAAALAGLIVNYFSVRPIGSLSVLDPENVLALLIFLRRRRGRVAGGGQVSQAKQGSTPGRR